MATDDDSISCAVCCEIYSDPRCLTCGHSFCLKCIKGIADNKQRFPCPICRYNINLIDGDVEKLPKNYGLGVVIEAKDKKQYVMCLKHSKLLDIFCDRCDMVICSKCLPIEHKGHVTDDIDKIYQERNTKADSINKSIDMIFKKWHAALNVQQNTISNYLKEETDKKMKVCDEAERALNTSAAKVKELEDEINNIRSSDMIIVVQVICA
ncbi:hypothetical protein CHS0354_035182 [Potamilus streckersoni]|uniref:Uncharacterized protein n=1 Tax=Potamilus streckersoni TaxID=2493646 RepID=A0AAE0VXJ4_9BIVA|nr:hypothetical protein CHS0354_035182 [Potamilus streckersoni]